MFCLSLDPQQPLRLFFAKDKGFFKRNSVVAEAWGKGVHDDRLD